MNANALCRTAAAVAILILGAGCEAVPGTEPDVESGAIPGVTASAAGTGTMVTALEAAELVATLEGDGPYTLFVPVDAGFNALPAGTVDRLLATENRAVLAALMNFHIVSGKYEASAFRDGQRLETLEGGTLSISVKTGEVTINGVKIRTADLQATNGVVHLIDNVLTTGLDVMEMAAVMPNLSSMIEVMKASGMDAQLTGNTLVTLFAPVDAAFGALDPEMAQRLRQPGNEALLEKVLKYHMLPGTVVSAGLYEGATFVTLQGQPVHFAVRGGRKINSANIVATDIRVSNGVIHLIDSVLQENLDLLDIGKLGGFDAFVAAVTSANDAGLSSALRYGKMTVFAPSNAAFAAAGAPSDAAALANLLRYHIVQGRIGADSLSNGRTLKTLQGASLTVQKGGTVTIAGVRNSAVVAKELGAANGVIHAVDNVLLP